MTTDLAVQPDGVVWLTCCHGRTWTATPPDVSTLAMALVLHQLGGPSTCRCLADLWRRHFRCPWPWLPVVRFERPA